LPGHQYKFQVPNKSKIKNSKTLKLFED